VPSLAAKAKSFPYLQGAGAPRLLHHQLFSPSCRLAKLAGQREGTAKLAREGESRQGGRVPSSRLRSMTQMTLTDQ